MQALHRFGSAPAMGCGIDVEDIHRLFYLGENLFIELHNVIKFIVFRAGTHGKGCDFQDYISIDFLFISLVSISHYSILSGDTLSPLEN